MQMFKHFFLLLHFARTSHSFKIRCNKSLPSPVIRLNTKYKSWMFFVYKNLQFIDVLMLTHFIENQKYKSVLMIRIRETAKIRMDFWSLSFSRECHLKICQTKYLLKTSIFSGQTWIFQAIVCLLSGNF